MSEIEGLAELIKRIPEAIAVIAIIFVVIIFLKHIKESQHLFQAQIDRFSDRQERMAESFLKASENYLSASEQHIEATKRLEYILKDRSFHARS